MHSSITGARVVALRMAWGTWRVTQCTWGARSKRVAWHGSHGMPAGARLFAGAGVQPVLLCSDGEAGAATVGRQAASPRPQRRPAGSSIGINVPAWEHWAGFRLWV
jgi:hypothetical protein